jgi:phosphoserine phosphatase RsbU/P
MATSPRSVHTTAARRGRRRISRGEVSELLDLQKSAHRISSTLDLDELIDRVAEEMVRLFGANEANIYLRDEDTEEMVLAAVRGCTVHGKGARLKIGKQGIVGHVAATGELHYAADVSRDPHYISCEPRTRSEVVLPLTQHGRVIGAVAVSHEDVDAFSDDCLRLLQTLAAHIEVAVNNARSFRQERSERERMSAEAQEAQLIQKGLFPKASPYIPGFAVTGACEPAGAVGGDWYDYIPLKQGRFGLVLADVCGKGMGAALLMSAARGILRSLAETAGGPGQVLTRLNSLLLDDFPAGRFVTMLYGVLDPAERTLTFANAGHYWPILADSAGTAPLAGEGGLPIGFAQDPLPENRVVLPHGSRLLFYSDGIVEARNHSDEEYGGERLHDLLRDPDICVDCMLLDVKNFAGARLAADDATLILLKAA